MSSRRLVFVYSPEIEALSYPPDCPFKTQRVGLVRQRLRHFGLLGGPDCAEAAARPATRAELEAFHTPRYLEVLEQAAAGELTAEGLHMGLGGPDTPVFRDLFAYGRWACGAALTAAEWLRAGRADVAFSLLGGFHHAQAERASGFCYLNDVVLACHHLAAGGRRVLCLDVDAHHGDGTQAAFYRRRDVLTISLHESGETLYPWGGWEHEIGEAEGCGFNVNLSLPAGTYDEAFLWAFQEVVPPLLTAYAPDYLVLELGLDTLAGDPLTHLQMTNHIVPAVLDPLLALRKPLLVLGGGGYNVPNTVRGWALAWRTCSGDADDGDFGLGGVMLGSAEWVGGLRDPARPVAPEQRQAVEPALRAAVQKVKHHVFRYHGLGGSAATESARADSTGGAGVS